VRRDLRERGCDPDSNLQRRGRRGRDLSRVQLWERGLWRAPLSYRYEINLLID
jgi:hypothetical protein